MVLHETIDFQQEQEQSLLHFPSGEYKTKSDITYYKQT